jgi:Coenzyme PQQ synthesis protein D (PqqD)
MKTIRQVAPLAREEGLVIQELPDELLIYDLDRHEAHCLNQTAAFIWKRCDGKTTVAEMAARLGKELNAPGDEEVIWFALDQLGKFHLLRERATRPSDVRRVSRREVLRKAGLAAAVGLPLVTSILAPTAKAQVSCLPKDAACTSNTQCCSGNCRGNGLCS